MSSVPLIPVILGPTASGKTSVGIELAKLLNGEIISVDSRKVYQGLPIGTATPEGTWNGDAYVVQDIPHYLMGFLDPAQPYTAGDFAKDADDLIRKIAAKGKTPILVGGTGFYFKALQQGLPPLPPRDVKVRTELELRIHNEGVAALYAELSSVDPTAAAAITKNDRHKIIRALEVFRLTGQPFSDWKDKKSIASSFSFVVMGIDFPKDMLDQRIEVRSRRMEEKGMIEETDALLKKGYSPFCPALSSFGYKEAVEVLQGVLPRSGFLPFLIHGTKAYAKRQRTWFRTQVQPSWFICDQTSEKQEIALKMKAFLSSSSQSN